MFVKRADIPGRRLDFRQGQFFAKRRHDAGASGDGLNDLRVGRFLLEVSAREVLGAHEPAVKGVGAAIFAVADDAVFQEQAAGIHLVRRIAGILNGDGAFGGAAGDDQ